MRLLSKCEKIVYQGRCNNCGSLIELDDSEHADYCMKKLRDPLAFNGDVVCPACKKDLWLGRIQRFYVNEEGVYSRG